MSYPDTAVLLGIEPRLPIGNGTDGRFPALRSFRRPPVRVSTDLTFRPSPREFSPGALSTDFAPSAGVQQLGQGAIARRSSAHQAAAVVPGPHASAIVRWDPHLPRNRTTSSYCWGDGSWADRRRQCHLASGPGLGRRPRFLRVTAAAITPRLDAVQRPYCWGYILTVPSATARAPTACPRPVAGGWSFSHYARNGPHLRAGRQPGLLLGFNDTGNSALARGVFPTLARPYRWPLEAGSTGASLLLLCVMASYRHHFWYTRNRHHCRSTPPPMERSVMVRRSRSSPPASAALAGAS